MRILLVEDDVMIGGSLLEGLHGENYAADWVRDGRDAELALHNQVYDLVLLDLGLPKKQGLDVLKDFRKRGGYVPILILTARDAMPDRVLGVDAGADDYLVKPFDLDELFARMRALLRRHAGRAQLRISHAGLILDPASHEVGYQERPVALSDREFALLQALLDPPGRVWSLTQLEEKLYGWNEEIESNAVEVYPSAAKKTRRCL